MVRRAKRAVAVREHLTSSGVLFEEDDAGFWTAGSWVSADGTAGETYGPGAKNVPKRVREMRETARATAEGDSGE